MLTAQQLEERAEEALALAARMRDAEARQAMIETARRYELLAVRAAEREQAERQKIAKVRLLRVKASRLR